MCSATCGFIAAAISGLFHGSFTNPMKGKAANSVNVDPLVFQTYKSVTCFVLCWSVLAIEEKFMFSPWGILSALIWVPGATAGIFAVRNIGVAAGHGIWSGTAVLVAGCFGFLLFNEGVKSPILAVLGLFLTIVGLVGMGYTSAPSLATDTDHNYTSSSDDDDDDNDDREGLDYKLLDDETSDKENTTEIVYNIDSTEEENVEHHNVECCSLVADGSFIIPEPKVNNEILICSVKVPAKFLGFFAAVFCGICAGTVFLPKHYADCDSFEYLISFAIAVLIITMCAWALRLAFETRKSGSISKGYAALPSLHLSVLWVPGFVSGLLWMIGSMGTILAVDSLGLGVGMAISASSLIISGLWGIFYFREVKGRIKICGWFASAICNLSGAFLLATQHED